MNKPLCLFLEGYRDPGIAMPKIIDCKTAYEIEIFPAFHVVYPVSPPFYDKKGKPLIRVHYILACFIKYFISHHSINTPIDTTLKPIINSIITLKNQCEICRQLNCLLPC